MTEPLTDEELRQAKHGNLVENHIDRLIATIDKLKAERDDAYERAAVLCDAIRKEALHNREGGYAGAALCRDAIRALKEDKA
jgi:protein-arginine kinase activator protein McsA